MSWWKPSYFKRKAAERAAQAKAAEGPVFTTPTATPTKATEEVRKVGTELEAVAESILAGSSGPSLTPAQRLFMDKNPKPISFQSPFPALERDTVPLFNAAQQELTKFAESLHANTKDPYSTQTESSSSSSTDLAHPFTVSFDHCFTVHYRVDPNELSSIVPPSLNIHTDTSGSAFICVVVGELSPDKGSMVWYHVVVEDSSGEPGLFLLTSSSNSGEVVKGNVSKGIPCQGSPILWSEDIDHLTAIDNYQFHEAVVSETYRPNPVEVRILPPGQGVTAGSVELDFLLEGDPLGNPDKMAQGTFRGQTLQVTTSVFLPSDLYIKTSSGALLKALCTPRSKLAYPVCAKGTFTYLDVSFASLQYDSATYYRELSFEVSARSELGGTSTS
eukprot:NODE_634_length_1311_cov_125.141047_g595_i0.p1 GENE.NODE_634_length_1311_cov_125.141047_g595_i0~~NODE_634_length_1311_cov_125.141047_g595_i0.p1  ORF type:complete len:410 (-),score=57.82 NODE_634_length_1311_cov_125.141047_g595_i0:80-1243(-)